MDYLWIAYGYLWITYGLLMDRSISNAPPPETLAKQWVPLLSEWECCSESNKRYSESNKCHSESNVPYSERSILMAPRQGCA